ncbi:MAG: hypothetical protein Roseis2KO_38260 [Roseivirga sp.]
MIKYGRLLGLLLFLLASAVSLQAGEIEEIRYRGKLYKVYVVKLRDANIQMVWKDEDGEPLTNFNRLRDVVRSQKRRLTFAMNGGIFNPELEPVGLYIEKGKQLRPLNLEDASGNFFLKPNGVFYIDDDDKAGIVTSEKYQSAVAGKEIRYAQQSGPQLLIDGKIHSAFTEGSVNQTVRNGVGIIDENTVVFAISQTKVNLHEFASMFKEKYGCKNALYLDGAISEIYGKADGDRIFRNRFSAMVIDSEPMTTEPTSIVSAIVRDNQPIVAPAKVYSTRLSLDDYWMDLNVTREVKGPERFWSLFRKPDRTLKLACAGGGNGTSKGLVLVNGVEVTPLMDAGAIGEGVFYITKDDKAGLLPTEKYKTDFADASNIRHAFQSGSMLVSGGEVIYTGNMSSQFSGMGFSRDDNSLVFISTDEQGEMTLQAFAQLFKAKGCDEAVLLNSGANALMLIRGVKSDLNQKIDADIPVLLSAYKKE